MRVIFAGESSNIKSCPRHSHPAAELIITVDGEAEIAIGREKKTVSGGDVIFVPPGVSHSHLSQNGYSDMFIHIAEPEMPREVAAFYSDKTGAVVQLGKMLCTAFIQHEKNYHAICDALLCAIYEYIIKLSESSSKYEFVGKFKDILTAGLSDPELKIKDETQKLGVSSDYMRHCFKEETGLTPLEYLTKIRITQAKRHLRQNRFYSVGEIAFLCGFSDSYYFSRVFKKHTGVSPQKYRST